MTKELRSYKATRIGKVHLSVVPIPEKLSYNVVIAIPFSHPDVPFSHPGEATFGKEAEIPKTAV